MTRNHTGHRHRRRRRLRLLLLLLLLLMLLLGLRVPRRELRPRLFRTQLGRPGRGDPAANASRSRSSPGASPGCAPTRALPDLGSHGTGAGGARPTTAGPTPRDLGAAPCLDQSFDLAERPRWPRCPVELVPPSRKAPRKRRPRSAARARSAARRCQDPGRGRATLARQEPGVRATQP